MNTLAAPGQTAAAAAASARSERLLRGPVLPTLVLLALPNLVVMLAQAAANFLESYFVGLLGVQALAGAALVFPLVMLMQTMSAGGMGGGISSAVARAIGAGDRARAEALALHAVVIALAFGLACLLAGLLGGPRLYAAMSDSPPVRAAAQAYATPIFCGAALLWLANAAASVLRGSGNMALPAAVLSAGVLLLLLASPALIFGWGPLPALGISGAGLALVLYYLGAASVLLLALLRGSGGLRLRWQALRWPLFRDILGVGAPAIVNNMTLNLSVLSATALVSPLGSQALAGFGLGIRLEYLQIPIVFGVGAAMVAMVGMNTGAGQHQRARRVAWTGAALAAAATTTVGVAAALFPAAWLGLFTQDQEAIRVGSAYLRSVGPAYGLFGLGLAMYFASQGAQRMGWSLLAGLARLLTVYLAGHLALRLGAGLPALLGVMVAGMAVFALLNAWPWLARRADAPRR